LSQVEITQTQGQLSGEE